jgi:anti-sigma-K factor RskA
MTNPPENNTNTNALESDQEDSMALAGEYVLGVLDEPERQAFEARLATDITLKQALGFWAQHFGTWSAVGQNPIPNQALSPVLWQRIQSSLWPAVAAANVSAAPIKPSVQELTGLGHRGRVWLDTFWRVWAGFATACAVGLAVYVVQPILQPQVQQPRYVAVLKSPDKTAEWLIEALPNDTVRLYQLGQLPKAVAAQAQGKSLELWTKAGSNAPLTSLGLVQLGQPWVLPAKALPALQNNQLFAVSLEPPNGAPHGQPTGPVVFAGEALALQ